MSTKIYHWADVVALLFLDLARVSTLTASSIIISFTVGLLEFSEPDGSVSIISTSFEVWEVWGFDIPARLSDKSAFCAFITAARDWVGGTCSRCSASAVSPWWGGESDADDDDDVEAEDGGSLFSGWAVTGARRFGAGARALPGCCSFPSHYVSIKTKLVQNQIKQSTIKDKPKPGISFKRWNFQFKTKGGFDQIEQYKRPEVNLTTVTCMQSA